MGKEKIKKIFSILDGKQINSGKSIVFSEQELKDIKSFCFSKEKTKKKVKKHKTKITSREKMLKNLEKARRARKRKLKQSKKGKK